MIRPLGGGGRGFHETLFGNRGIYVVPPPIPLVWSIGRWPGGRDPFVEDGGGAAVLVLQREIPDHRSVRLTPRGRFGSEGGGGLIPSFGERGSGAKYHPGGGA